MYWKLNRLQFPVYNLGHGRRLAIWVQGCNLHCQGCINPELWPYSGGKNINLEQLTLSILELKEQFDGITITGGEPFQQYEQLITFCTFLKQKTTINILVFSGYTIDQLTKNHPDKLFLTCIDYLIDGPFQQRNSEKKALRGSSNQNFYTFESGKIIQSGIIAKGGKWSVSLDDDNRIFMAGIPGQNELPNLTERLMNTGIKMDF